MSYFELYLPPVKPQKQSRPKIIWTPEMFAKLTDKFPNTFNKELAEELGISWRTLIRKARELGLEKEESFLEKNKTVIQTMAKAARSPNKTKGQKGWTVPGGEKYQFKPGHIPKMKTDKSLVERVHKTRNETIRRDRIRRKIGLTPLTKFKLK